MSFMIRQRNVIPLFTAVTVFVILIGVLALAIDLRKRELNHAEVEAFGLARMLMEQTQQSLDGVSLVLSNVQERMENNVGVRLPLDSLPVHLMLGARISGVGLVDALFLVDAKGTLINSSRTFPVAKLSAADRDYYRVFAEQNYKGTFVSRPVLGRANKRWTIHMARAISSPDGTLRGVVIAAINLDFFEKYSDKIQLDFFRPIGFYFLDGTLVASLPHRADELGQPARELQKSSIASLPDDHVTMLPDTPSSPQMAIGKIARYPLLIGVAKDEEDAMADWRETIIPICWVTAFIIVAILIVAIALMRKMKREQILSTALREADDRYQKTIASVMDAIVAIDENKNVVMFNAAAEQMFGYPAEQVIGTSLDRLVPSQFRHVHDENINSFALSSKTIRKMSKQSNGYGLRADGSQFPFESTIARTEINGRVQFTAVLRDVTERQKIESELRGLNRQLRDLFASREDIREEERTRIARELHDELGQQLTALKLDLSWIKGRLRDGREIPVGRVDGMQSGLDATIASVRRISSELRPPLLDDLGFSEALAWHTGEFAKRCGIEVTLDLPAGDLVENGQIATVLYRIVQESLNNVAKHSGATHVAIMLATEGDCLRLTVSDNGRGLGDRSGKLNGGIGIVSMRERAAAAGGSFSIGPAYGSGTKVEVRIPLVVPIKKEEIS